MISISKGFYAAFATILGGCEKDNREGREAFIMGKAIKQMTALVLAAASVWLYAWLKTRGAKRFAAL